MIKVLKSELSFSSAKLCLFAVLICLFWLKGDVQHALDQLICCRPVSALSDRCLDKDWFVLFADGRC